MIIAVRVGWSVALLCALAMSASLAASTQEERPLSREVGRGGWGVRAQVPQIPATFYGSATVDGKAPPDGSAVRGIIAGLDCTQPGAAGTITADGVGAYVISVMHESQKPGCGKDGATVSFTVAGRLAGQSASWRPGPQQLGLNAGSGQVQPLPSNVPIPTGAAPSVTAVPPTDDIQLPGGKTATPLPPGTLADSGADDDSGPGIAGLAIAALLVTAIVAGAAGMLLGRRKPPPSSPPGEGPGEPG